MTTTAASKPILTDQAQVPPQDLAAERSVLGAALLSKDAIADVIAVIRPQDFYRPGHELIFGAIVDLYNRGEPADAITIVHSLQRTGDLVRSGGAPYIHTLVAEVPTAANAPYYARIVRDHALRRGLAAAGIRIAQWSNSAEGPADELADRAQAELFSAASRSTSDRVHLLRDLLEETVDLVEAAEASDPNTCGGLPTGFRDLDELTDGLHPGQLVVLGARPSCGKTTLALDVARATAVHHGQPAAFFSLEMTRTELTMRVLSAEARVPLHQLRTGRLSSGDWERLSTTVARIAHAPLYIDDSPGSGLAEIRAKCRRLAQRHGLRLVLIDYLQLLPSAHRHDSRQNEVAEHSRSLKLLAKDLEIPVVALSQLNRAVEHRQDRRPALADLRESGAIEQDSDVVILLHRDDLYDRDSSRAGEADFIVAKQRNGPTATVTVAFQGHYSRFVDMAPESGVAA